LQSTLGGSGVSQAEVDARQEQINSLTRHAAQLQKELEDAHFARETLAKRVESLKSQSPRTEVSQNTEHVQMYEEALKTLNEDINRLQSENKALKIAATAPTPSKDPLGILFRLLIPSGDLEASHLRRSVQFLHQSNALLRGRQAAHTLLKDLPPLPAPSALTLPTASVTRYVADCQAVLAATRVVDLTAPAAQLASVSATAKALTQRGAELRAQLARPVPAQTARPVGVLRLGQAGASAQLAVSNQQLREITNAFLPEVPLL
jgi:hypothetical protein